MKLVFFQLRHDPFMVGEQAGMADDIADRLAARGVVRLVTAARPIVDTPVAVARDVPHSSGASGGAPPEPPVVAEPTATQISRMRLEELRALAVARGLDAPDTASRRQLIAALAPADGPVE